MNHSSHSGWTTSIGPGHRGGREPPVQGPDPGFGALHHVVIDSFGHYIVGQMLVQAGLA